MFLFLLACGDPSPKPFSALPPLPVEPVRDPATRLLDHAGATVAPDPQEWVGTWDGVRPFDDLDPFAHRGPTSVIVTRTPTGLTLTEGVGANAVEVALTVDPAVPNEARGAAHTTERVNVIGVEADLSNPTPEPAAVLRRSVVYAGRIGPDGTLRLARVLDTTIFEHRHEEDVVELVRRPPPPPAPPPPAGFEVLADGLHPALLVSAGQDLVFVDRGEHDTIRAVPRAGGPVRTVVEGLGNVLDLVVRGDTLFYADAQAGEPSRIASVPVSGGTPTVLVEAAAGAIGVWGHDLVWGGFDDAVYTRPISGGPVRTLLAAAEGVLIGHLVTDDRGVVVATSPLAPGVDGQLLAFGPGGRRVLATGGVAAVTLAGAEVWWVDYEGVLRHRARGDGASRVVVRDLAHTNALVVAGSRVVMVPGMGIGEVGVVPAAGGARTLLVEGRFIPEEVVFDAADPRWVYVTDAGYALDVPQGRVGRIALER